MSAPAQNMKSDRVVRVKRVLFSKEPFRQKALFLLSCFVFLFSAVRARLGRHRHNAWPYYMMQCFRRLGVRDDVQIQVPNPLVSGNTLRLSLDLRRNMHVRYFFTRAAIDDEAIRMIGEAMAGAECFLDVGSNSGIFALSIAQAFPTKTIIAVEPVPDNARTIRTNIALNALTNVRVVQAAASSQAGELTFYVHPFHDGGGGLDLPNSYQTMGLTFPVPKTPETITIATVSLDSLTDGFDAVVMKIDVEGHEHEVLRSGDKAFARGVVRSIILEVSAHNGPEVLKFCEKFNFIATYFDGTPVGSLEIDDLAANIVLRPRLVRNSSMARSESEAT